MEAELRLRFSKFTKSGKEKILQALHNQYKRDSVGYNNAIKGLPQNELQWLVDFQTGLLIKAEVKQ